MTHTSTRIGRSTPAATHPIALPILLGSLLLAGCAETETDDALPPEAELEFDEDATPLTEDEIDAVRDAHVVASLPVDGLGAIEIITDGADTPAFSYILLGANGLMDVIRQLEEQDATPAEVFVALSPAGEAVPTALVDDHHTRVRAGDAQDTQPRTLSFSTFRALDQDTNYCTGSYATFVDDWEDDFDAYWDCRTTANPAAGNHGYSVPSTTGGRVLSACDSDTDGSPMFVTYQAYLLLGGSWSWTVVWSGFVYDDDAVHLYSGGSGAATSMTVNHGYGPAYVAYGYAPGCIP